MVPKSVHSRRMSVFSSPHGKLRILEHHIEAQFKKIFTVPKIEYINIGASPLLPACTREVTSSKSSPYRLLQSIRSHSISWKSILILSSHLLLDLPSGLLPSGFPTKILYTPFLYSIRVTCPAHLILLDFITRTILGEEYRSLSSLLCSYLHSFVTSSLLRSNILLNTLFSNILSLRSSLNVSEQVSHPYKTTCKIIVLYILMFIFFDSSLEDKRFCTEC